MKKAFANSEAIHYMETYVPKITSINKENVDELKETLDKVGFGKTSRCFEIGIRNWEGYYKDSINYHEEKHILLFDEDIKREIS